MELTEVEDEIDENRSRIDDLETAVEKLKKSVYTLELKADKKIK